MRAAEPDAALTLARGIWAHPARDIEVVPAVTSGWPLDVLDIRGRPRLLISPGPGARRALRSGNGLRAPRDRTARWLAGVGVTALAALPQTGVLRRLTVRPRRCGVQRVTARIAETGGLPTERVLVTVRTIDDHYKPTITFLDACGTATGYAKLGWTPGTAEMVRREAGALAAVRGALGPRLATPDLLGCGDHGDRPWLLTAPIEESARRSGTVLPDAAVLAALAGVTSLGSADAATAAWRRPQGPRGALVDAAGRRLSDVWRHGVELGRSHGDWVPWNTARVGSRTIAWDWEHYRAAAPVGVDAVHWQVMTAHTLEGLSWDDAYRRLLAAAPEVAPLALFHATDLLVRSETLKGSDGSEPFPLDDVVGDLVRHVGREREK